MFIGVSAIDAHVILYCCDSREAIGDVIHAHLEYVLGHFEVKWHVKEVIVCLEYCEM